MRIRIDTLLAVLSNEKCSFVQAEKSRPRRTKDSKCTHVPPDRTLLLFPSNPFSAPFSLSLHHCTFTLAVSICLFLSLSLFSHVYHHLLFQFPGFMSKEAFCCCAAFRQSTSRVECRYAVGFPSCPPVQIVILTPYVFNTLVVEHVSSFTYIGDVHNGIVTIFRTNRTARNRAPKDQIIDGAVYNVGQLLRSKPQIDDHARKHDGSPRRPISRVY